MVSRSGRFGLAVAFACVVLAMHATPAAARLAVLTTGKPSATIVDLGRKQVVARPNLGLATRGVALTLDGLRAYVDRSRCPPTASARS
jgi:hypothetical protein